MGPNETRVNNIKNEIELRGFNVQIEKLYGRYIIQFDKTGLQMRELNRLSDLFLDNFIIVHYPQLSIGLCVNTNISVD